jgi:hypothetical protein
MLPSDVAAGVAHGRVVARVSYGDFHVACGAAQRLRIRPRFEHVTGIWTAVTRNIEWLLHYSA